MLRTLIVPFIFLLNSSLACAQGGSLFSRAFELLNSGDYETSIALFRRGLELEPNNGKAHYYLGQALTKRSPPDEAAALQHFNRAAQLDPSTNEGADAYAQSVRLAAKVRARADNARRQADAMVPPTMYVGDRWVWRSTGGQVETVVVTSVDGDSWEGDMTSKYVNGPQQYHSGWNTSGDQGLTLFPLEVGRTISHSWSSGMYGNTRRNYTYRVVRWERVRVQAGEFVALRLEHDGEHAGMVRWYSPSAKAVVLWTSGGGRMELVEYSITRDGGASR